MTTDIGRLVATLTALRVAAVPAMEKDLHHIEIKVGHRLPEDCRNFYLQSNGTGKATPPEHGWVRFWPLSEWRRVGELAPSAMYANVRHAMAFADHCDESWWYAFDVTAGRDKSGAIYIVDGLRPARQVAQSFSEFLKEVLEDQPSIYPVNDS